MNPNLAKKGAKIKVYIPTLNELLDEGNNHVVVIWKKNSNNVLEKKTISFKEWYELKEYESIVDATNKVIGNKEIDKSPGSKRFLEKVPIFMSTNINGKEVQMGSALHETDWWNERNIANFIIK